MMLLLLLLRVGNWSDQRSYGCKALSMLETARGSGSNARMQYASRFASRMVVQHFADGPRKTQWASTFCGSAHVLRRNTSCSRCAQKTRSTQ